MSFIRNMGRQTQVHFFLCPLSFIHELKIAYFRLSIRSCSVPFILNASTSHKVLLQIRASGALCRTDWCDQSTLQLNTSYGELFQNFKIGECAPANEHSKTVFQIPMCTYTYT